MWRKPLINAAEITSNSILIDCSWHFKSDFNGYSNFLKKRIPGSRFFDLNKCVDSLSTYPHMLPSESEFSKYCGELGIKNDDSLVFYDSFGLFSAPRIWWMFKVFGHSEIAVLDGGLKFWAGAVESGIPALIARTEYVAKKMDTDIVIQYNDVLSSLNFNGDYISQFLDARSSGRFNGTEPEPRPIPSGHVPGSINIPFGELLNSNGTMKSKEDLLSIFGSKRVDLSRPIICSCGSGVTAAVIFLALELLGLSPQKKLYDGSWSEYASMKTSPIQRNN